MLLLIKSEKIGREFKLTFSDIPGFWGRLFFRKPRQREFVGSETIWRELPDFRRVDDFFLESRLCDEVKYIEHPLGRHLEHGRPCQLVAEFSDGGKLIELMRALGTDDTRAILRLAFATLDMLNDHQIKGGEVLLKNANGTLEAMPKLRTAN